MIRQISSKGKEMKTFTSDELLLSLWEIKNGVPLLSIVGDLNDEHVSS